MPLGDDIMAGISAIIGGPKTAPPTTGLAPQPSPDTAGQHGNPVLIQRRTGYAEGAEQEADAGLKGAQVLSNMLKSVITPLTLFGKAAEGKQLTPEEETEAGVGGAEVAAGMSTPFAARGALGAGGGKLTQPRVPEAVENFVTEKPPAGAAPPVAQPPAATPLPDVVKQTGDELHRLHGAITADRIEIGKRLEALPPEFKTREVDQRLYEKAERPEMQLSPEEQAGFDQHFEPMRREVQQLASVAKKMGYPIEDKEYMHRVLAGKVEHTDVKTGKTEGAMNTGGPEPLGEEGAISPVPQMGTGGRSLSRTTGALRPRSLYVLEAEDGKRAVVSSPSPGYLTVWNKGKGQTVKWGDDLELGQPIMVNGKRLTVKNAKTSELEADTPYRFHKSAMVNMADALVKMRATVRNIQYLDQLTKSPSWLEHATRAGGNRRPPPGWRTPKIPQLKDWVVEPRLADALDDFYKPGFDIDSLDWLRRANRFAVGSLFWNPIPHIENVAGHWYVGRGWDWVRPTQYAPLVKTSLRAIKSVITQDELYRDLLKKGSGLISGGVANKDFYLKMAKKFELDVQRDPSAWEKVGRTLGMGTYDLAKGWYGWMNNVLWQANDMFMLQRVIELEGKGMSRLEAIKEAEKHIPNYRIPTTVMGQRWIAQFMSDPAFMAFGRYRYGVWNSYSNMVKDTFGKSKTMEERKEAMGNMMALGSLALVIYPAVSWGIEKLTGDKDARKMRRGPASIPDQVYGAATQPEKHWYDFLANQLTFAPVPKEMLEQITNRDSFTGRHIEEPGEHSAVRRATQRIEHAAETMVQPYQAVSRGVDKLQEEGVPRQVLDQVIGIQEKTQKQKRGQAIGQKIERNQAKARRKKPRGLLEKFEESLE